MSKSIKVGYTLFDTAFKYKNESAIGNVIGNNIIERSEIIIETKLCDRQYNGTKLFLHLDRENVRSSIKHSCTRLKTNYLDIYLLHGGFSGYINAYKEMLEAREEGLVKVVGICGAEIETLKRMKRELGEYPMINQIEVHPQHSNKSLIHYCQDNDIQVEARSPFAHGDLLGGIMCNPELVEISKYYHKTIPQIILKWIIQQDIIAVARSSCWNHLRENIDIFDFKLSLEEMSMIDSINIDKSWGFVSRNTL